MTLAKPLEYLGNLSKHEVNFSSFVPVDYVDDEVQHFLMADDSLEMLQVWVLGFVPLFESYEGVNKLLDLGDEVFLMEDLVIFEECLDAHELLVELGV